MRRSWGKASQTELYPISHFPFAISHALVLRPSPSLGRHPVNHLVRVHDVARLAVHAVRGVDLETTGAVAGIDHFVDVRGAEARAGVAVLLAAARAADVGVVDDEV